MPFRSCTPDVRCYFLEGEQASYSLHRSAIRMTNVCMLYIKITDFAIAIFRQMLGSHQAYQCLPVNRQVPQRRCPMAGVERSQLFQVFYDFNRGLVRCGEFEKELAGTHIFRCVGRRAGDSILASQDSIAHKRNRCPTEIECPPVPAD